MKSEACLEARSKEVIRLLATHDVLSVGALRRVMTPNLSEKQIRTALLRLEAEGLVRRRLFRLYGGSASFYEIADPIRSDKEIATLHESMLMHNDLCAFSVELLQRAVPDAICVREHAIHRSELLRNVMKYQEGARDSLPDILLVVPGSEGRRSTFVAVEVERSVKSSKRLLKKFTKYASRTLLDGVIYLSEDERVLTVLRQRYQEAIAGRALRIRHYKDHFLVTAGCPTKQGFEIKDPRNSVNEPVSLSRWMQKLAATSMSERRDNFFRDR